MERNCIRLNLAQVFAFFVTFGLFLSSSFAYADCPELSIDSRFQELESTSQSRRELTVGLTQLLSETFTPYLVQIHDYVTKVPAAQIREYAASFPISPTGMGGYTNPRYQKYAGVVDCHVPIAKRLDHFGIPYTQFNRVAMNKLLRAVCVTAKILVDGAFDQSARGIDATKGSVHLLSQRTFADTDLSTHLFLALLSVSQSAAQLTSDSILQFTDEEILRSSMQQGGSKPSLMVLHSLILPPDVIGPYGSSHYIPNAVMFDGTEGFVFTPKYREFIKEQRAAFVARAPRPVEFGHGCPVGHCLRGEERPGLQYFIDAILYVYDRLGEE